MTVLGCIFSIFCNLQFHTTFMSCPQQKLNWGTFLSNFFLRCQWVDLYERNYETFHMIVRNISTNLRSLLNNILLVKTFTDLELPSRSVNSQQYPWGCIFVRLFFSKVGISAKVQERSKFLDKVVLSFLSQCSVTGTVYIVCFKFSFNPLCYAWQVTL